MALSPCVSRFPASWWLIAALPLIGLATGCNDGSRRRSTTTTAPATAIAPATSARVRVLHASADAPAVDVIVDGTTALSGVPYGAGSDFLELASGPHNLKVNAAGSQTTVIDVDPTLDPDRAYLAIAVGRLANIEPLLLEEDLTAPQPGELRVRVIHAHPLAGKVDVYVTAPGADLAAAQPTLSDVEFKDASGYLDIPAGSYQARLTPAGQKQVVYDSGTLNLPAGEVLTLVAAESTGGASPVQLFVLSASTPAAVLNLPSAVSRLRAVHASPDAPAVDVLIDGTVALAGVSYKQFSPYAELISGAHRIQVNPANSTASVIDATPTLDAGSDYTVIAVDRVAQIAPLLLKDDNTPPAAGNVKVRLVHGAPSAGLVDVYVTAPGASLTGATPTIAAFAFKDASPYLEVPAGDYRVRITLAGTQTVAIDTGALSLQAGQIRTGIAVDPGMGMNGFGAVLLPDLN